MQTAPSKKHVPGHQRAAEPLECKPNAAAFDQPLLRGLSALEAGYAANAGGPLFRQTQERSRTLLVYCVKGGGWCEVDGRLHTIRKGDLLVIPEGVTPLSGGHLSNPWTVHWASATGAELPEFLRHLGVSITKPVASLGDDPQITRLFTEIRQTLDRGDAFLNRLHASRALGHLLAVLIRKRHESTREVSDVVQKVAEAIIYISEHFDQPLRIAALARMANLSAAHFTVLFKQQAGCSPRDYLHLLRIHHACELLASTGLSIKEIAARLGYQDQFHFSRQFKAFQNVAPTEYRDSKSS